VKTIKDQENSRNKIKKFKNYKAQKLKKRSFFLPERQVVASQNKKQASLLPLSLAISSRFNPKPKRRPSCGFVPMLTVRR